MAGYGHMVSPGEWRAPGVPAISQHQAAAPWPPSLSALTLAGSTTGDFTLNMGKSYSIKRITCGKMLLNF